MFWRLSSALLTACLVATEASGQIVQEMTPERIREAIALGARSKALTAYKIQEKARFSWLPQIGVFTTPFLRVALAAHTAKKRYKPFTETDVTPEMVAPEIHVYAPSRPLDGAAIASVDTIVVLPLDSKDLSQTVHPIRATDASEQYKNLFGFTGEGRGMLAAFPLNIWREDNEIHVVFDKEIPSSHGPGARGDCTDCNHESTLRRFDESDRRLPSLMPPKARR